MLLQNMTYHTLSCNFPNKCRYKSDSMCRCKSNNMFQYMTMNNYHYIHQNNFLYHNFLRNLRCMILYTLQSIPNRNCWNNRQNTLSRNYLNSRSNIPNRNYLNTLNCSCPNILNILMRLMFLYKSLHNQKNNYHSMNL